MRTARTLPESIAAIPGTGALKRAALAAASLRLTLVAIALLAVAVLAAYRGVIEPTWTLAAPLSLLALNLAAAIATHAAFRTQAALLVFHLALLAFVILVAAGRLTYLKGHLELSEGQAFEGALTGSTSGPLHRSQLERLRFTNLGFEIDYAEGVRRGQTRNIVGWIDADGVPRRARIGDNVPLVLEGYRFYTSFNKGFAPIFTWHPRGGAPARGTIHLPAYPAHEYGQALEWTLPGSAVPLWIMLDFDEVILDPERSSSFRVPNEHRLIARFGDERRELAPGDTLALPDGRLRYEGLSTWMGYTVSYDWTTPWLAAAAVLAALGLAWHLLLKMRRRPWDAAPPEGEAPGRSAG